MNTKIEIEIEKKYWSCGNTLEYQVAKNIIDEEGDIDDRDTRTFKLEYADMSLIYDSDYDQLKAEGYDIPDDYWKESDASESFAAEFEEELKNALDDMNVDISGDDFASLVREYCPLPITNYINITPIEDCRANFKK